MPANRLDVEFKRPGEFAHVEARPPRKRKLDALRNLKMIRHGRHERTLQQASAKRAATTAQID
jgi:hypothetical protein